MTCSKCKSPKPSDEFLQCAGCRETTRVHMRRWRATNNAHSTQYMRRWQRSRRARVLEHYGGHCACCGEAEYEFLAVDHIDGGGEKHRAEVGQGSRMIDWILKSGFPKGFRVLCHNCNQAIGYYGECPHVRTLRVVVGDE
jgi:hypothetical protein